MPMDPQKRRVLEALYERHRASLVRDIPPGAAAKVPHPTFVAAKVDRYGEDVYLFGTDSGFKNTQSFKMNALAAARMAIEILEAVKDLFPDSVQVSATLDPQQKPH